MTVTKVLVACLPFGPEVLSSTYLGTRYTYHYLGLPSKGRWARSLSPLVSVAHGEGGGEAGSVLH